MNYYTSVDKSEKQEKILNKKVHSYVQKYGFMLDFCLFLHIFLWFILAVIQEA